jgi:hypothetical protein
MQEVEQVTRAGLRALAECDRSLAADLAGPRLPAAEAAEIRYCSGGGVHRVGSADLRRLTLGSVVTARQQHQHDAEPECHPEQKKHDPHAPRSSIGRLWAKPSSDD